MDEDSHSSAGTVPGPGASLPSSSGPGLTSPPYTATPIDHDYVKCKKPHQQAAPDGTVPVLPTVPRAAHQLWGGCLSDVVCRFVLARGCWVWGDTGNVAAVHLSHGFTVLVLQDMLGSPSASLPTWEAGRAGLPEAASF